MDVCREVAVHLLPSHLLRILLMYVDHHFIGLAEYTVFGYYLEVYRLVEIQGVGFFPKGICFGGNVNAISVSGYVKHHFTDVCSDGQGVLVINEPFVLVDDKRIVATKYGKAQSSVFTGSCLAWVISNNAVFDGQSSDTGVFAKFVFNCIVT